MFPFALKALPAATAVWVESQTEPVLDSETWFAPALMVVRLARLVAQPPMPWVKLE